MKWRKTSNVLQYAKLILNLLKQFIEIKSKSNLFKNNNYWQWYTNTLTRKPNKIWYDSPVVLVCANMVVENDI